MKTGLSLTAAAIAFAALPLTPLHADPFVAPAAMSVDSLRIILAAGASQCDDTCMARYDTCVTTGLAAQAVADDEVVYEDCSEKLETCRNVCINQGSCIMDDTGVVICP